LKEHRAKGDTTTGRDRGSAEQRMAGKGRGRHSGALPHAEAPLSIIEVEKDAAAFQGWKAIWSVAVDSVFNRPLATG